MSKVTIEWLRQNVPVKDLPPALGYKIREPSYSKAVHDCQMADAWGEEYPGHYDHIYARYRELTGEDWKG